jgi:DNA polymerase I-like protein with 3'-5' exonuclease and polymerase domains
MRSSESGSGLASRCEGTVYGGSKGTPEQERWYKGFRERYSDLAKVQSNWVAEVLHSRRLITPWGLRYYWPNATVSKTGYCNVTASVYNYPVQALATAEIIPVALVALWQSTKNLRAAGRLRVVNTVHDSVVIECAPDVVSELRQIALDSFGRDTYAYLKSVYGLDFDVALGCGIKIGSHWGTGTEESYNMPPGGKVERVK